MANLSSTYLSTVLYEMYTSHQSCSLLYVTKLNMVWCLQKKYGEH